MFTAAGMKTRLPAEQPKIEVMADHVTRFSLAGIREVKRQLEAGELNERNSSVNESYGKERRSENQAGAQLVTSIAMNTPNRTESSNERSND
jgi:hypothetical protein